MCHSIHTLDDMSHTNLGDKVAAADGGIESTARQCTVQRNGMHHRDILLAPVVRLGLVLEPARVLNGHGFALVKVVSRSLSGRLPETIPTLTGVASPEPSLLMVFWTPMTTGEVEKARVMGMRAEAAGDAVRVIVRRA